MERDWHHCRVVLSGVDEVGQHTVGQWLGNCTYLSNISVVRIAATNQWLEQRAGPTLESLAEVWNLVRETEASLPPTLTPNYGPAIDD